MSRYGGWFWSGDVDSSWVALASHPPVGLAAWLNVSPFWGSAVEPACRAALNLRYQLLPYTYTLAREAHDTGMPLMRPLWLHHRDDEQAVPRSDEFLWGRDLLIAL